LPPALGKKTPVKANGNLLFPLNHSRFVCKNYNYLGKKEESSEDSSDESKEETPKAASAAKGKKRKLEADSDEVPKVPNLHTCMILF
jgi:hypothetical protein